MQQWSQGVLPGFVDWGICKVRVLLVLMILYDYSHAHRTYALYEIGWEAVNARGGRVDALVS